MRIVVDAMGGDHGCEAVVSGVKLALAALPQITQLHLVGNEAELRPMLEKHALADPRLRLLHASQVLTMEDKPVEGLRRKKDCSLLRAVDLLRDGVGDALVSLGNTGGMVAASTIRLRTLPGVERPAIATVMPSEKQEFILIDAGANPDCKPLHLAQFAIMGNIYSRELLGRKAPRVGILSNGTEESKGTELTREASKLCSKLDLNFIGYVEGHDLYSDKVEVVVTDGFTGNIVLKTSESLAKGIFRLLKSELTATPVRKFGAYLSRDAFRALKKRMDPEVYGGAPLLGLNGNVIKAHGSAQERAIMNAIRVAGETVAHHINDLIIKEIAAASSVLAPA